MNKKIILSLAAILALGLSSCNGGKEDSSSSTTSSSSSTTTSSSSTFEITDEELEAAKTWLETNPSVCSLNGGYFNEYCTEGEKEIIIPKAGYNVKNNLGDVTIMDGTSSLIGLAEDIDGAEYNDENDVGFRDWKLNACTVNPALSICSSVANKKYDEANTWSWRLMVDAEGKIIAMYPGGNTTNGLEPYFSNYEYSKTNNDNMFVEVAESDRYVPTTGTKPDTANHANAWAIADGGFNIVEHADHRNGRYEEYWFVANEEVSLVSWAFLGVANVGTLVHSVEHLSEKGNTASSKVENDVWYLSTVPYGISIVNLFVPGQFDDVKITFEEERDADQVPTGNYVIKETFSYDPWSVYQKIKAYKDYLVDVYDNLETSSADIDDAFDAIDNEIDTEEAIYALNSTPVRESGDDYLIYDYTTEAINELKAYKQAVINFRKALFEISE